MKTLVILGAGQFGKTASTLLKNSGIKLIAFGDNSPDNHGTFYEHPLGMRIPVMSVSEALNLKPDIVMTGVAGAERSASLEKQALDAGFSGTFVTLEMLKNSIDIRSAVLIRTAKRLHELYPDFSAAEKGRPASIAELGVYKGEFSAQMNALFPDRTLYLFDTFEGFDERDVFLETDRGYSRADKTEFSDTSEQAVVMRMPHKDKVVVRKGYFPETARGLEDERFIFVSLDADLYAPLLAGLEFFCPRLLDGGMIMMHDYGNERFRGAYEAVKEYEKNHKRLCLVPLCDLHHTAVIVKT